jgi:hypothetical protein
MKAMRISRVALVALAVCAGAMVGAGCAKTSEAGAGRRMGETFVVLPDGRTRPVGNPGSMKVTQTNGVPVVRVEAFRE